MSVVDGVTQTLAESVVDLQVTVHKTDKYCYF